MVKNKLIIKALLKLAHEILAATAPQIKEHKLDDYCLRAIGISSFSHDKETQVGALLINKESGAVIADGFNGFCRQSPDDKLPTTRPDKYPYIIHAEENLLCNAVRHGISTNNCAVFSTLSPCIHCVRLLWQCGIDTIYFRDMYRDMEDSKNMKDIKIDIKPINGFYKMTVKGGQ